MKIKGIQDDALITAGIIAGGYFLVKSFLPTYGVSDEDKSTLDNAQTMAPAVNPFSPYYSGSGDWLNENLDLSKFNADTSDQALFNAFTLFKHGGLSPSDPAYDTINIFSRLYTALIGHLITGDQQTINAYLNAIESKAQASIVANIFLTVTGRDFFDVLRNGSFPMIYGLNGTDLAAAINRINNLPNL